MLKVLYDLLILLWAVFMLPIYLWNRYVKKKEGSSLKERFFPNILLPTKQEGERRIWIHAVSLGELRAAYVLYKELKVKCPSAQFVISYQTITAARESLELMPEAVRFYLPLDFSFIMKKLVGKIQPDQFYQLEGDYWFNLLDALKNHKIPVVICSAKMSETSYKRYKAVSFFSKKLFSIPFAYLLQNASFEKCFLGLGVPKDKLFTTGNIKESFIDEVRETLNKKALTERFGITSRDFVITIGSTHEPEEDRIAEKLKSLLQDYPQIKLIFVPRHPNRFAEVEEKLRAVFGSVDVYSKPHAKNSRVFLLDTTGMLCSCYLFSRMAIVGGSFIDGIGGHNIMEPILRNAPAIFGPFMEDQKSFVSKILSSHAGIQVSIDLLENQVRGLIEDQKLLFQIRENGEAIRKRALLPVEETCKVLTKFRLI